MTSSISEKFRAAITAMLPPAPHAQAKDDAGYMKQAAQEDQSGDGLQSWLDSLTGGGG